MLHILNEIWLARYDIGSGLGLTLLVSVSAIVAGTMIGTGIGVVLTYSGWPLRFIARIYVDLLRGTPVLVLILAAFYVPSVIHVNLNALEAGVVALAFFCGAHVGEVVRGALQSIAVGQVEAAKSIGLTFRKTFFYVLMPQAIRQAIPAWTNAAVEIVKATTLLSIIGVPELILNTQQLIGRTFINLPFYLMVGILYFLIDYGVERFGRYVDARLSLVQGGIS